MNAVLRLIDGVDIEGTHNLWCDAWLAIDDAYHLTSFGGCGVGFQVRKLGLHTTTKVFHAADVLSRRAVPDAEEDTLQVVDGIALNATMHVTPFAHLLRTFYIIVSHIHAARIGYASVDDYNLTVVASVDVVHPGKSDRGVLHNVDTLFAQGFQMMLLQRLVVGIVAKAIEHSTYLDTLATLLL